MMFCVVNRLGVLVGEAFGVVGELFVDCGVVPNSFLMVIVIPFVAFLKRLGYQCCVGHLGIITIAFVLSLPNFVVTFPSKLKRGKI